MFNSELIKYLTDNNNLANERTRCFIQWVQYVIVIHSAICTKPFVPHYSDVSDGNSIARYFDISHGNEWLPYLGVYKEYHDAHTKKTTTCYNHVIMYIMIKTI